MTISVRFYGFAHCFYNISRRPAALIRLALGRASFPRGKLLFRVGREPVYSDVVLSGRFPERHTGRSLRFRWWVDSFIRTGYIRNVPCGQNRTTPRHVIPSERSESRNLPELQILPCVGSFTNVVDSSTPLRSGRNDIRGDVFWYYRKQFRPFGPERHAGRSLRFRREVVSFNHTGYIRYVAWR